MEPLDLSTKRVPSCVPEATEMIHPIFLINTPVNSPFRLIDHTAQYEAVRFDELEFS